MKGYFCYLQNERGALFAQDFFTNRKEVEKWARGRPGEYTLIIEDRDGREIETRKFLPR